MRLSRADRTTLRPGHAAALMGALLLLSACATGAATSLTPTPTAQLSPGSLASAQTPTSTPTPGTGNPPRPAAPTPTPEGQAAPTSTPTPSPTPEASPTATPKAGPASVLAPTVTAVPPPVTLKLMTPLDSVGVEVGAIRVKGVTSANALTVNGSAAEVGADGGFEYDLVLRRGVNLVRVEASDSSGVSVTQRLLVFFGSTTAGLPLTLLYPPDGLEVNVPYVDVVGVTRPDAIVGVNELPAEINGLGIFSMRVDLKEGNNLIEVVAVDIDGNVRFQTSGVFYVPQ